MVFAASRMLGRVIVAVACAAAVNALPARAANAPTPGLIVFLGDSITYRGLYIAYAEACLRAAGDARPREFLNLGLSSETTSGLSEPGHAGGRFPRPDVFERLGRVLAATKPQTVFACYGMNDGIYLELSPERFMRFQQGIQRLRRDVEASGAAIVHLTPPVYETAQAKQPAAGYAAVLDRYSAWLNSQGAAHGWQVLDVHQALLDFKAQRLRREPGFAYSRDGVHPADTGHWLMARVVLGHLAPALDVSRYDDATSAVSALHPRGADVLRLVVQRQEVLRDAWLSSTGHQRPGIAPGLPLPEANTRAAELDRQLQDLLRTK